MVLKNRDKSMNKKFDYNILRLFPYTVFVLFIVSAAEMIATGSAAIMSGGNIDDYMIQMSRGLVMVNELMQYIASTAIFLCLYHMVQANRWFNRTYNMFIGYMLTELLDRVTTWLYTVTANNYIIGVLLLVTTVLPAVFLMLGMIFLLEGMSELFRVMLKKKEAISCLRISGLWMSAQAVLIMISTAMIPVFFILQDEYHIFGLLILIVSSVYYIVICALVYFRVKSFCMEYYMFVYNNSITGGTV